MFRPKATIQVEQVRVEDLKPYDKNARKHSQFQVQQIADSIAEFGFNNPILVDPDLEIIAGHGRLEAAKHMDLKTVPVIKLPHLTPEQKKAYVIADNKLALNATWDTDQLMAELKLLEDDGMDLTVLGFSEAELASLVDDSEGEFRPEDHMGGMPGFENEDQTAKRQILMNFKSNEDALDFARIIGQEITDKTKFLWHPQVDRRDLKSQVYEGDGGKAPGDEAGDD